METTGTVVENARHEGFPNFVANNLMRKRDANIWDGYPAAMP